MFSGSVEGGVSVWENLLSDRDPLRLLHRWDAQVTGCGGQRDGRLALSPRGDRVFLADGRAWLKILHWRTGERCGGGGFTVAGMDLEIFRARMWEHLHNPSIKHLSAFHRDGVQTDQSQQHHRGNRLRSPDRRALNWLLLRSGKRRALAKL